MCWMVNDTLRPFYPRELSVAQCIGLWLCPRVGLDGCGKSRHPSGIRTSDRPACSESLYRLSYRASQRRIYCVRNDISLPAMQFVYSCGSTAWRYVWVPSVAFLPPPSQCCTVSFPYTLRYHTSVQLARPVQLCKGP